MKIATLVLFALVAGAILRVLKSKKSFWRRRRLSNRWTSLRNGSKSTKRGSGGSNCGGNRIAHNFDDQPIWERKKRPEPPPWLAVECHDDLVADGRLANACYILRHWDEQPLLILQRRTSPVTRSAAAADDKVVKQSFLRRVHLTGGWLEARYPATPAYGIIGMQVGVVEAGRFTLPAVGMMVVMVPDSAGGTS